MGATTEEAKGITHGSGSDLGLPVARIRASRWLGLEIGGDYGSGYDAIRVRRRLGLPLRDGKDTIRRRLGLGLDSG
jgi:hypothetical protein